MVRWRILRTLLYKEVLRFRYNGGLLVVVVALLALSALVSVGSRSKNLAGFGASEVLRCSILYREGTQAEDWARHLRRQPPPPECTIRFRRFASSPERPVLQPAEMAIELRAPSGEAGEGATWRVRYWYPEAPMVGSVPVRDWLVRASNDFLGTRPRLHEETSSLGQSGSERVPLIVTALAIFAVYLLSFNLYITSTAEEREKRILLGLLLTPASPVEIIAAKAIFYATASGFVSLTVVGMYQPRLLLNPFLLAAVALGSVSYVAIGTVVLSVVRRQTTLNTISLLYLIATGIIMILSQFLPLFMLLQALLVENYLHGLMKLIVTGASPSLNMLTHLVMLSACTVVWSIAAIWVFSKQGMAIARAR